MSATDKYEDFVITIPFNVDFRTQVYTYHFYSIFDILTYIGGLIAASVAALTIIAYLLPFFPLYFMFKLSKILSTKADEDFRLEIVSFLNYCQNLVSRVSSKRGNEVGNNGGKVVINQNI